MSPCFQGPNVTNGQTSLDLYIENLKYACKDLFKECDRIEENKSMRYYSKKGFSHNASIRSCLTKAQMIVLKKKTPAYKKRSIYSCIHHP